MGREVRDPVARCVLALLLTGPGRAAEVDPAVDDDVPDLGGAPLAASRAERDDVDRHVAQKGGANSIQSLGRHGAERNPGEQVWKSHP